MPLDDRTLDLTPSDLASLATEMRRLGYILTGVLHPSTYKAEALPQGTRWVAEVRRGNDPDMLALTAAGWAMVPF